MAALTPEEEQRRRRRMRLSRGLLLGGAAIGLPALANALVARRVRRMEPPTWAEGRRYAWREGEVVFQQMGAGEPVLLLHSFGPGHDSTEWRHAAEILAQRYQVYAPDLLGWGRSEKPGIAYDGELYIQLIIDFLNEVVGRRCHIAAAGLPAAYAVQVGVDHPELLRGLALVVPLGVDLHGDEPDLKDAIVHRLLRLPVLGTSALNLFTSRAGLANYLKREVYHESDRIDSEIVDHHYRASHQPGAHAALAAYFAGYLNHSVTGILPRLALPVWVGWGRDATSPAVETADLWIQQISGAELAVLDGCGILPHAEIPAEFCEQLERFLTKNLAG